MDEEPMPYQPPDLETSNTMDVSPYQGPAALVDTISNKATFPRKSPPATGRGTNKTGAHVRFHCLGNSVNKCNIVINNQFHDFSS